MTRGYPTSCLRRRSGLAGSETRKRTSRRAGIYRSSLRRHGGKSMSAKHLSLRGLAAWFAAMTVILGGFGGSVQAKLQDATAQDSQDKKDEKKDEKKDDKKGLSLKPTRKIE